MSSNYDVEMQLDVKVPMRDGVHLSTDIYLHDTMFVVGHFHFTMAATSFLASFAGIYFWWPKITGKCFNEGLAKGHFWFSFIFITLIFTGQMVAGYAGHQRRLYDPYVYHFLEHLRVIG